jgi:hypothetical protein
MKSFLTSGHTLIALSRKSDEQGQFYLRVIRTDSITKLRFGKHGAISFKEDATLILEISSVDRKELLRWLKPLAAKPARHVIHDVDGCSFDLWANQFADFLLGGPFKK